MLYLHAGSLKDTPVLSLVPEGGRSLAAIVCEKIHAQLRGTETAEFGKAKNNCLVSSNLLQCGHVCQMQFTRQRSNKAHR